MKKQIDYSTFCVAKRGKVKYLTGFGLHDYYKYYQKTVPFKSKFSSKFKEHDLSNLIVSEKLYKQILRDFFHLVAEKMIMESKVIRLPHLGRIRVQKKKMNFAVLTENSVHPPDPQTPSSRLKIDYKASKEAKALVYFTNDHRNNYSYKFSWARPANKGIEGLKYLLFTFRMSRTNKRLLAHILKTNKKIDYYE